MSNAYEYMRQVVVRSVCVGGIVDDNGRFLKAIGNMPLQEGDTVWTDGRIVYGHRPVRPQVNLPTDLPGIPYSCEGQHSGAISKSGHQISKVNDSEPLKSSAHNWMYTDGKEVYTNLEWSGTIDAQDSGFYYDMLVTKDAVWTAAPTLKQFPFLGKAPDGDREVVPAASLEARNFKYYESDSAAEWFNLHGEVRCHTGIQIRRNGAIVSELSLEPYQIALDRIKALYDQYDTKEGEVKARYYYGGTFSFSGEGSEYVSNIGIFIAHITSEVVNFHFTDEGGAWEMILATSLQGSCAPHTIDRERVKGVPDDAPEEQKWQKVHSWFCFLVPCIYYLIKVTSDGQQKILQFWISVKPFPNNLVPYYTDFDDKPGRPAWWDNARSMQVRPVNSRALNMFQLNYPDGIIETDFRTLRVYDKNGNIILNPGMHLLTFDFWFIPDPNFPVTGETRFGATNQMMYTVFETGETGTADVYDVAWVPFQSGSGNQRRGLCVNYITGHAVLRYGGGYASVLGHLSIRHLDNVTTLVAIGTQYLFVIDKNGKWTAYAPYCHNMGVQTLKRLRRMRKPKDIKALIASKTKGNDDDG